ncbi:MAG: hypothetical protein ABEI74_04865 [Candidatus Pacearchaeota archaeon]
MKSKIFSIKQLAKVFRDRQKNEFDCNIVVSGERGNGKSTFLFKLLSRFDNFDAWKQQVYSREDVINLLEQQEFGIIFDDEAISTGYKREFHNVNQQKLIKMMNMYRDNFNIFASAIPSFGDLDKDMKKLMKFHIQIIKRGVAIVHMANNSKAYSQDPWDIRYNEKLEEKWNEKKKKNPRFSPPYHKLTTFMGYVHFGDLPERQKELYKKIKKEKRKKLYEEEISENEKEDPQEKMLNNLKKFLLNGGITSFDYIKGPATAMGFDYEYIRKALNKRIQAENPEWNVASLIQRNKEEKEKLSKRRRNSDTKDSINTFQEEKPVPDEL